MKIIHWKNIQNRIDFVAGEKAFRSITKFMMKFSKLTRDRLFGPWTLGLIIGFWIYKQATCWKDAPQARNVSQTVNWVRYLKISRMIMQYAFCALCACSGVIKT